MKERRVRLIINPLARGLPPRSRILAGAAWLRARGWQVDIRRTQAPGHAVALAAEAATAGYDCVAACGGDGTLNEALNGLVGTATALAVVPGGTANVWAREARIPRSAQAALALIESGSRRRIDAGRIGDRSFLLMASAGLDSFVVGTIGARFKRAFGVFAYLSSAAIALRHYTGVEAVITLDGERIAAPILGIIAGNTRSYGGIVEVTRRARVDDGLLDVCLYFGSGQRLFLEHLLRTSLGRHLDHRTVLYRRVRQLTLETAAAIPVQADGELVGLTPVTISVAAGAITVVVPAHSRSPLWRE